MNFIYPKFQDPKVLIYDLETYPNIFTAAFENACTGRNFMFEISTRKNEITELLNFLTELKINDCTLVGFNNIGFDWPILDIIMSLDSLCNLDDIYEKAQSIINTAWNNRFSHIIYNPWINQIDLMKIHHFDNPARATSLKTLEINMRMDSVRDLPFPPGTILNNEQMDILCEYNWHDIDATKWFFMESQKEIKLRKDLSKLYDMDMTNFSDAKMGSEIFINQLEKSGVKCFEMVNGRKEKRQTKRESISLKDCILPYIKLEHPEFNRILEYIKQQTIKETKGVFTDLKCTVEGLDYILGTGGLHASVHNKIIESDDGFQIIDVDVASYYPNMAISNELYPEHLGIEFCSIYKNMYDKRKSYKKGTAENAALKIALNATYGNSGNKYSPMYDLKYLLSITLGGQLSLLMLVEQLIKTPTLTMIQCNTDGVTYRVHKNFIEHTRSICEWWKQKTKLELEEVFYSRFWISDVNNYIAEYQETKKLKSKGKYCYGNDLSWNQNHSMQIVPRAVEKHLTEGIDIDQFIKNYTVLPDFILSAKVPRNSILMYGGNKVENIVRYVVSKKGESLTKVMPPKGVEGEFKRANGLTDEYYEQVKNQVGDVWDERINTKNKSVYEERRIGIQTGYQVCICNDLNKLCNIDIDYDFYTTQAKKLLIDNV